MVSVMASKKKDFFFFLKNTKTNLLQSLVTLAQQNQKIFVIVELKEIVKEASVWQYLPYLRKYCLYLFGCPCHHQIHHHQHISIVFIPIFHK